MYSVEQLVEESDLTLADTKDGLYELAAFFNDEYHHAFVMPALYAEFDKYLQPWNPGEDAVKLVADIANETIFRQSVRR